MIQEVSVALAVKENGFFRAQGDEYYRAYRVCYEAGHMGRLYLYHPAKAKIAECFRAVEQQLTELLQSAKNLTAWTLLDGYKQITGAHDNCISLALGYNRTYLNSSRRRKHRVESLKDELVLFIKRAVKKLKETSKML